MDRMPGAKTNSSASKQDTSIVQQDDHVKGESSELSKCISTIQEDANSHFSSETIECKV